MEQLTVFTWQHKKVNYLFSQKHLTHQNHRQIFFQYQDVFRWNISDIFLATL